MKTRYLIGEVTAKNETQQAFLCSLHWPEHGFAASDLWVPKSVIHPDSLSEVDDACDGDVIEIGIAEWWLNQQF